MPASPVEPAVESREQPTCPVVVSIVESGRQQEARKIKRLVAMFRLWGSKSEMQMTPLGPGAHLHRQDHRQDHQQQQRAAASAIDLAHGPGELIGGADTGEVPAQRLWQSLVVPLVLGCVIFLLAIWTRQISLLVVNDAIVMVLILGSVFIVMSAVAFWLAQEQQQQQQPQSSSDLDESADSHPCQHLHHCPHHNHNHHHHHHHRHHRHRHRQHSNQLQHLGHQLQQHQSREPAKCCSIAFIDLQPPDYYSALRDSFPVAASEELDGAGASASEPPSYAELASHQLEYQDHR